MDHEQRFWYNEDGRKIHCFYLTHVGKRGNVKMTNLEKMKEEIISAIQGMDADAFEDFMDSVLTEKEISGYDGKTLLRCSKCEEKYGPCKPLRTGIDYPDGNPECGERFRTYCQEEAK